MDWQQADVNSQEYMESMRALMSKALETPRGLQALAAAITPPIEQEIKRKEISSLLLSRHVLPRMSLPVYQKRPQVKASWISSEGEAQEQELGKEEVEFSINRIHSNPMVDVSVLRNGNIGALLDIQISSADEIRKEMDKRTIKIISQSVAPQKVVTDIGGSLSNDALKTAFSLLEDMELSVKYIVMRGSRFNDIHRWDLDPQTKKELQVKGVLKTYAGANILLTSAADPNEVLLIPDKEVGKLPVREILKCESVHKQLRFKTGWLVWSEIGQGITRPDILAKIKIH